MILHFIKCLLNIFAKDNVVFYLIQLIQYTVFVDLCISNCLCIPEFNLISLNKMTFEGVVGFSLSSEFFT